jgi:hypothetical protein
MTKAFIQTSATTRLPTLPYGWPISSYGTYKEAKQTVDHLADNDFRFEVSRSSASTRYSSSGSTPT